MPVHTPLPEHHGELVFAEQLSALADDRMHLWFDLHLPGVANLDVVIWDSKCGVVCLEVKAIPVEMVLTFSDMEIEIEGRGWSASPMHQVRKATFELRDFLRGTQAERIHLSSTVAWPKISRDAWQGHWGDTDIPSGYELSMVFSDDLTSLDALRRRLEWVRERSPWGSSRPGRFVHKAPEFDAFARRLRMRATRRVEPEPEPDDTLGDGVSGGVVCETAREPQEVVALERADQRQEPPRYRERVWLGTESVTSTAQALQSLIGDASAAMPLGWGTDHLGRIGQLVDRLDQPFRLGVVGEFRSGKSSIVNAMLGHEVAVVREFECTFAPQRFYWAETPSATLYLEDGSSEAVSVEAGYARLLHAAENHTTDGIVRAEFGIPAPILQTVDIWDAPGLGGSDRNQEVAELLAEQIDAALWVFNASYIGTAAVTETLTALQQCGKLIIGVVNKCEDLSQDDFERVTPMLLRAYAGVQFTDLVPMSALLALDPDTGRDTHVAWAVDAHGGFSRLMDVVRRAILDTPGRTTARAAAGDLRAIAYAVRDDLQSEALRIRRQEHLYQKQLAKVGDLLQSGLNAIARDIDSGLRGALRGHLIQVGTAAIQKMSDTQVRDEEYVQATFNQLIGDEPVTEFFRTYLRGQEGWVSQRLVGILEEYDTEFGHLLTELDRGEGGALTRGHAASVEGGMSSASAAADSAGSANTETPSMEQALTTGVATSSLLGLLALIVPGPQWPVVIAGGLASAFVKLVSNSQRLTTEEMRSVREGAWHKVVGEFIENPGVRAHISKGLEGFCSNVHREIDARLPERTEALAFGHSKRTRELQRVAQLGTSSDALGMLIEQLGSPVLGLPAVEDILAAPCTIAKGARERSQQLIRRVLGQSREVLAVTDGALSARGLPLLLDVPDATTIRILAWVQPLSAASDAFRLELAALRRKRSGATAVATPVPSGTSEVPRPAGCWVFVPGRAFRFSVSLADAWMATTEVEFEPHDDDGRLYEEHFSRWWEGDVEGYQTLQVR